MNILLIGNSPCVNAMEIGDTIDEFDGLVARFNSYKTTNYEKYVGTRSDIWITCGAFQINMDRNYKEVLLISILLNEQHDKNEDAIGKRYPNLERVRYETVFATKQMIEYNHPSSGAIAVMHYLSKGYKVYLYGFNFMIENMVHHYSDKNKKGDYHRPEKEWLFFNKYLMSGKIEYLGWNRKKQSTPILRTPAICGGNSIGEHRGSTQMGWYNWIARECINRTVLDVGCGLGNGLKHLVQAPGSKVYGVDEDPNLCEVVENYICGLSNVAGRYDIVLSVDVIEHVINDIEFFNKLKSITLKKLYIITPNFSRSLARNPAHCRELTISQFVNTFKPDELWVASPDGWFNLQQYPIGKNEQPLNKIWNYNSVDKLEWAHMCGVWKCD